MPATEDLVTLAEAKTFVNVTQGTDDAKIATLITRASNWIEQATQRKLAERAYTNLRLTGCAVEKLYVPAWPIKASATITIKLDEVAQTVWKQESDGDVDAFDVVVASDDPWDERWGARNHFYRRLNWASALGFYWQGYRQPSDGPVGRNRVLLSYTGGYNPIPEDLKQACCYLVQKIYLRDQQKQLTGITVLNLPAGGSVTFPERGLPQEVRELIAPYMRLSAPIAAI